MIMVQHTSWQTIHVKGQSNMKIYILQQPTMKPKSHEYENSTLDGPKKLFISKTNEN